MNKAKPFIYFGHADNGISLEAKTKRNVENLCEKPFFL